MTTNRIGGPAITRRLWAAAVLAAGLCGFATAQERMPHRPVPPRPPILRVPEARLPIEVARVQVDAQVVGLSAQTRVEMEFRNPNERVLEGELQFPLRPGQTVTGFALDIDGELRPAVPVEKDKGRQVFEDVTRARVDPALLESTEGNNYRVRVYPLPARGTRRVVLELSETLGRNARQGVDYVLPLEFNAPVGRLDVTVQVPRWDGGFAHWARFGGVRIAAERRDDGSALLRLHRDNYDGRDSLRLDLAQPADAPQVQVQSFGGGNYFLAEVPVAAKVLPRPAPSRIAIVWDASGSAASRDVDREFALLDTYFKALRRVDVDLVVVRDEAEAPRRFGIANGDWQALREHLRALPLDGATRLDRMAVPAGADLALLFTDGVSTYGERKLPASAVPLYTVSSSAGADSRLLRRAAEAAGGQWLDLLQVAPAEAATQLRQRATHLAAIGGLGATDLVAESAYARQGRIVVAGRLTSPEAAVTLDLQAPDGTRSTQKLQVAARTPRPGAPAQQPIAAYRWATLRLADLEVDPERNVQAIRRLGKQFGLVTSGTSLIVLDAVADYARHEIEPPASLRAAYEKLLAQGAAARQASRGAHVDRVAQRFAEKQAWWDKDFPKDAPPAPKPDPRAAAMQAQEREQRARTESRREAAVAAVPAARMMAPAMAPPPPPPGPGAAPAAGSAQASIALQKWTPDAAYARRLRAAAPADLYAIYLDERPGYVRSTAFFLDAAEIFFERGQDALARRILSNLAEMDLGNRHVLRILAYRLLQAREVQLALPLLRKVLVLSPDEPQSYRDLGLALEADGQHQAAIEQLWEVVSRPWAGRFPDIELVALAELNAIVARTQAAGGTLDTSAVDRRLLRNLPLDLRAVLGWDADNTDIDLHVVDPNGEEAFFGHRLTYQGGRMSNDFTGGYGPEEFSLKQAKPGRYTVRARFYGHRQQIVAPATTLMLRLSTGFGTTAQKDSDVILRLAGKDDMVLVGTFEVAPPAATAP